MTNDDPFRDWLAETKKYADDNWDPTLIDVLDDVIDAYDALKAAAAADDAGTANHANGPFIPDNVMIKIIDKWAREDTDKATLTDDPDDQEAYDAAMDEYRSEICDMISGVTEEYWAANHPLIEAVARQIAALPTPVKGGGTSCLS